MKTKKSATAKLFLATAQHSLAVENLPRILKCLEQLSDDDIWWRPNDASNSIGNLVLHLSGNMRQWIISGLGGAPDTRERELEFSEAGPIPRKDMVSHIRHTVIEACAVLGRLSDDTLTRKYDIQGFHVTGLYAASHVSEHFAYHTGQIIFVTKMKREKDLKFTKLPPLKRDKRAI